MTAAPIEWTADPTTHGHRAAVYVEDDGQPLIAFPDRPEHPGWVQVWGHYGEHAIAQASYLESLPLAPADMARKALEHYARAYPETPNTDRTDRAP